MFLSYVSQLCFSAEHRRNLTKHDSRNEERVSLYCLFVERSPSYTYVCVHICVSVRVGQYTFLSFEERIRQNIYECSLRLANSDGANMCREYDARSC